MTKVRGGAMTISEALCGGQVRGDAGRSSRTSHRRPVRSMGDSCWTYESGEWEDRSGRGWQNPGYRQTDRDPVVCVNWNDARAYAALAVPGDRSGIPAAVGI